MTFINKNLHLWKWTWFWTLWVNAFYKRWRQHKAQGSHKSFFEDLFCTLYHSQCGEDQGIPDAAATRRERILSSAANGDNKLTAKPSWEKGPSESEKLGIGSSGGASQTSTLGYLSLLSHDYYLFTSEFSLNQLSFKLKISSLVTYNNM